MDSSLNLLDDSFNLRDLVDASETSWIVTELFMDVTKAEGIVTSTPKPGIEPPPLSVTATEDSGSSIDFHICPPSVIVISDDSSTLVSTNIEMMTLFEEESMVESDINVDVDGVMSGISWGQEIDPDDIQENIDVDGIMSGISWGQEIDPDDIQE